MMDDESEKTPYPIVGVLAMLGFILLGFYFTFLLFCWFLVANMSLLEPSFSYDSDKIMTHSKWTFCSMWILFFIMIFNTATYDEKIKKEEE